MRHTARLTRIHLLVPVLLLLFVLIPESSSDAKGNYVALGFGLESCQTFLQARSNGLDLPYRHWLTGYLTAVNKLTKDTVDMRGTTDIDVLCQEGWPLRQQDWPFGLQEAQIGQRKVFQEEDAGLDNRIT